MLIVTTLLFLRIMWKWVALWKRKTGCAVQTIAEFNVSIPFYLGRICHVQVIQSGKEGQGLR